MFSHGTGRTSTARLTCSPMHQGVVKQAKHNASLFQTMTKIETLRFYVWWQSASVSTIASILADTKLGPALVEDPKGEDGSPMTNPEGSDEEMDEINDSLETRGRTMNIKDPSGIDHEILLHEVGTPLYEGSPSNRLTSTLMLLVCYITFVVPNNFVDELFKLLKETILSNDNTLPKSFYEAKCLLMKLELSYDSIHACRGGCYLFNKKMLDATECPKCHKSRYVDNSKTISVKVLRHFPLIPRLRRMYSCTRLAKLMKWHVGGKSEDKVMRSVVDSKVWDHENNKWP